MYLLAQCYENGAGVEKDSLQALQWYQRAAEKGYGDAALSLGRYYLYSNVVERDTERYVAIAKQWAEKGYANGIYSLGHCYLNGFGVAADTNEALRKYNEAAEKGSAWAHQALGRIYEQGIFNVAKDSKKAEEHYLKAIASKEHDAEEDLAYFYARQGDFKKALKHLNESVRWGLPFSRLLQTMLTFDGEGVQKNQAQALEMCKSLVKDFPNFGPGYSQYGMMLSTAENPLLRDSLTAISLFRRGVELNDNRCRYYLMGALANANEQDSCTILLTDIINNKDDVNFKDDACFVLGNIYLYGESSDPTQAVQWYERGVNEYKSASCARALAEHYANSEEMDEYGPNNPVVRYYTKAVELGDTTALVDLGKYYAYNGDLEHAEETFNTMVNCGHYDGYYWLAAIYAQQSEKKTLEYLTMGSKKGNALCSESLGRLYEEGVGDDEPDYKKAEKYYLSAATAASYDQLGKLYLSGSLGKQQPKDIKKGLSYIEKAADMGYIDAIYRMGYLYETGNYMDSADQEKALGYYRLLAENNIPSGLFKMGLYYELGDGGVDADSVKALAYYNRAAEMGHGEAMCYIGDFYRIGQYVPLDKEEAFRWYAKADSVGEEIGTYYVARSYLEGCGVAIDSAAALPYLRAAAAQGVGKAAYLLGEFYNHNKAGIIGNGDTAMHYYVMAYQNGSADAAYVLGVHLYNEDEYQRSFNLIYEAARAGNANAILRLAAYLQEGIGTEADPEQAYQLFEICAKRHKLPAAYSQMGLARLQGKGCTQDESLGKKYLDTAAALGNTSGMYYLALCYINGYGCEPDSLMAMEWLSRSADSGYVRAMNLLGDNYEEQEDYDNAVRYFQKAADMGSWDGMCNLGYCYETGHGVILSFKRALELYQQAASEGSTRGMKMVANCYLQGNGVEKDYAQAIKLLEQAAGMGDMHAMFVIGQIYEEGDEDGTFQADLKKAKEWYKKAAAMGFKPAETALSRF